MRQIGTIPDGQQAEKFADFLRGQGTSCSLDAIDGGWAVWIQDEDQIADAKQELQKFLADPEQERYRDARKQAVAKLREDVQRHKTARRNQVSLRNRWETPLADRCPLTMGMLLTCAVVAFFTRLGGDFLMPGEERADFQPLLDSLFISPPALLGQQWAAILSGEVWRIWTPMFIHFGWLHLIFNGYWLRDFGMMLEDRLGSFRFLVLVLVVGAVAHLWQFEVMLLEQGKHSQFWKFLPIRFPFGGMSGVNYGLFGYLWVRGKLDPDSGLGVSEQTMLWMGVWFLVCWTGFVGPVANWAHAGGLAAGVGLGALASLRRR